MQYKITKPSKLLNSKGELIQKGYATAPILAYRRADVAKKYRLKEWDYYLICNDTHAVALTVGKSSSILIVSVSLIDFAQSVEKNKTIIRFIPNAIFSLPQSSLHGDIIYKDREVDLAINVNEEIRSIQLEIKSLTGKTTTKLSLVLSYEPKDSMVIATPFKESKQYFYYNRKIVGMSAKGFANINGLSCEFPPQTSYGILDWGRGVWPYKTTWYWSAAYGDLCNNTFGFNLGYGFGDTSCATENMLFYNGIANKLKDVVFHIPRTKKQYDYMSPWIITSSDHRLKLLFTPIYDRSMNLSVILLSTEQHQVFGSFHGWAILDDGSFLQIKDLFGFAERVKNRW